MSVKRYEVNGTSSVFEDANGSLVDYEDYAALEARCAALAAENAGLKAAVIERKNLSEEIRNAGRPPHSDFWHQSIYMADKKVDDALNCTASTDAFLAEVRAQGVDLVCDYHKSRCEALRDVDRNGSQRHGAALCDAIDIAYQLRKGVQS